MSQQVVAAWLKDHPGWHTSDEICRDTRTSISCVRANLRKLGSWGEAIHRPAKKGQEWRSVD